MVCPWLADQPSRGQRALSFQFSSAAMMVFDLIHLIYHAFQSCGLEFHAIEYA